MASSLDIAPALGHGIVTAQTMPGGYDAIDDRRQWAVGRQEGATTALAYKVTQRAAGASLQVDVATDQGAFLVQGDDVLFQGLYLIPATALKATLDLETAPDITNPRVDQVFLEARDDAHTHDGITRGRLYVKSGTPTSGASVVDSAAYTASKAALPPSTARVAEFVVPANAGSITNANIRDRRTWALGAHRTIVRNANAAAGNDYSTSSTAYAALDGTNLAPRIECSGVPLRIALRGGVGVQNLDFRIYASPRIDGAVIDGGAESVMPIRAGTITDPTTPQSFFMEWEVTPTPGSHVIAPYWRMQSGGGTIVIFARATNPVQMVVEEILRPNAANG